MLPGTLLPGEAPGSSVPGAGGRPPKEAATMSEGTVKWFNPEKGFGFITPDEGGPEIFVHTSALQATGLRHLGEKARVMFDIAQGPRGPQAINVHKNL